MPFEALENLWRPGRRHEGNEIETEFNNGVASLANGAVRVSDFGADARLPPFLFARSRSRAPIVLYFNGRTGAILPAVGAFFSADSAYLGQFHGANLERWYASSPSLLAGSALDVELWRIDPLTGTTFTLATAALTNAAPRALITPFGAPLAVRGGSRLVLTIRATAGGVPGGVTFGVPVFSRRWVRRG